MAARTLLAVLLFIGAGFAGCISGNDDSEEGPQVNTTQTGVNELPPDGRDGKLVAFEEVNETEGGAGGVNHHHDYWEGSTRVTLFEGKYAMEPFTDDQNRAFTVFNIDPPGLVYEATGQVEFTISNPERRACEGLFTYGGHYICTDYVDVPLVGPVQQPIPDPAGGPGGVMLRYRHGSASEFIDAGTLEWGKPLIIKITDPRQTDMPHSTSSLWQFMVISPNAQDTTLAFTAKAEIVRSDALDVPLWPGHPLFYTPEKRIRDIHSGPAISVGTGVSSPTAPEDAGPITPTRLISYGTKSVYIWANITSLEAPNPAAAPTSWYLRHTNATGISNITNPFDTDNHSAEAKNHFWILPVDDADMDSPYQSASRWTFELRGALTTPVLSCYNGCADYVVKYDLTVKASDIEEEGYEIYCEDSRIC